MFARRRSFLSPCLNFAFLTCCLIIVGHVSSMSLDRQRRQYQQQNDKQLELSDLMLPEAESEMLQNDMELVPAVAGNRDMYLLVPASAASPEQNLQSLTELNESQNSGNVESNSDMLMQESEDAPAVQILELPEDDLKTKIRKELVANNELDQESHLTDENKDAGQVSESMLNTIAEAAQEIENEIDTQLVGSEIKEKLIQAEHAKQAEKATLEEHINGETGNADTSVHEQKNSEQEMIGVVKEQSAEAPAVSLEAEDSQNIENSNENMQLNLHFEDTEMQPATAELTQQSQEQIEEENTSEIEKTESDESFHAMELSQPMEEENEKFAEIKAEANEPNQVNKESEISKGDEPIKSEKSEAPTEMEDQKDETNVELQSEDENPNEWELQSTDEIPLETLGDEDTQLDEEIKTLAEDSSMAVDETEMKIEVDQAKKTNAETDRHGETQTGEENQDEIQGEKNSLDDETRPENEQTKDEIQNVPIKTQSGEAETESLEESQAIVESQSTENFQPAEEIENSADTATDEKHPDYENQNLESSPVSHNVEQSQLTSELQAVEEFNKADEEKQIDEQSQISESNGEDEEQGSKEDQKNEEVHPIVETPHIVEVEDDEEVQNIEDKDNDADQTETVKVEAPHREEAEDFLSNVEPQPIKEIQSNEESQNVEKLPIVEEDQTAEEIQMASEVENVEDAQLEEAFPIKNSQTAEETPFDEKTEVVDEAQPAENTESSENIKFAEEGQYDELTHIAENAQTIEESKPVDVTQSVEETQSIDVTEDQTSEDDQTVEKIQSVDEVEEEIQPLEETQTEAAVSDTDETIVENVQPVGHGIEMESLFEETEAVDKQPLMEMEQSSNEQQESKLDEAEPLEISDNKFTAEESKDQEVEEIAGQSNENIQQTVVPIENNKNENVQDATAEIQKPLEGNNSDNILNNDTNESEPIKETTSMLTTIVQVPTNEELTQQQQQQQHQEHEQLQEHQITVVETVSSTTSKPFNVLDSVLNYVNGSFTSQISSDDNIKQEVEEEKEEEEQTFSSKLRRYDGAQVWRIVVQNDRERKLADELQTKYDGQLWKEVKQEVDYLLKPQVLADAEKYVRGANLSRIVLIDNLQKVIEVENPPPEEIALLQNRKGYRLSWQAYHRLEDIHGYFDYLAKTYPDTCSVEIIGYSIEKRPLKVLKISNGNANNTGIWIDGGMHAREWISPAVVTYVAHQIVEGWDDLPAYMRNINWYIHAVANPDGYEYSHTTDRLWRKNMRSHGRACPGVDLNRNFGYKWGGKGTSANPCSQTYRGSKAFSEPETFYISKFISNFPRETFKGYLSFHSYGQYILYPWGYDYHITNDMADLDLVARQAGTIITKSSGSKFTVGSSATTLYPAAGGSDDWAKGIAGIKYSYTIEMGDTGRYGFILPADYIEPNGKNGLTVVQTVAKAITMGKNGRRRKLKAYRNH